ncbi:PHD finger protein 7-like [Oxyura jamaicensis]|uniref:PHD finger protein 7-like n=1 Tax=Oxyura jamaicensis TaxID=8884 RepID=UPI0015A65DDB|nr:PHD finger protein 7-like [Oxyura jamaicensis]
MVRADAPAAPWRWRALRTPWGCAEPLWLGTPGDALPGAPDQALAGIPWGDLPGPQGVLSGGMPAPIAAALPPPECVLCRRSDSPMDGCGPMQQVDGVCAHVFCLYPAQGLYQRGAEGEGLCRFLPVDIRRVAKRAARKRCCVCRKKGATVACRQKRCSRRFHLPCGSQRGCISQFFGDYSSFCWEHRPQQTLETLQEGHTMCIICMETVEDSPSYTTMVCPSCKHAWFHRGCIQGQALRAGLSHFACPHCRDQERFVPEMLLMGIQVPDMKPAWEEEEEAVALSQLYGHCDARRCLYRGGREQWEEEGPWQLLLCSSCAASGTHRRCSRLGDTTQQWECAGCAGVGTGKGHRVLRLGAAEPFMTLEGRTAKLGPLRARQGGQIR